MHRSSWWNLLLFFGLWGAASTARSADVVTDKPVDKSTEKVVQESNRFAWELYAKLKSQPGNLFYSPYSVSTALAMTYSGARGETAANMAKALHFGANDETFHVPFGRVVRELNSAGEKRPYQLTVANALWTQQGENFPADFVRVVTDNYNATAKQLDFKSDAEAARRAINEWVDRETHAKIKEVLRPGDLKPDVGFVLTNAIYFKSAWQYPFNEQLTKNASFTRADGSKVEAPTMNRRAHLRYARMDKLQAVELPYADYKLSMVVLLPDGGDGLPALENKLSEKLLAELRDKLQAREVSISLPKFQFASAFELSAALSELGMRDAFTPAADFSGIGATRKFQLALVVHKALVDVREEGTEAAAVTVLVPLPANGHSEPPMNFKADHPFVFLIRENRTGCILFMGRVVDPQGS